MHRLRYIGALMFLVFSILASGRVYAQEVQCSTEGYTVLYINGIFTEREDAEANLKELSKVFGEKGNVPLVNETTFKTAYNPTHIAGLGDVVKAIIQKIRETTSPLEDYDLMEMVRHLEGEVQTQKILIVGHSQGTFYANALYTYLIQRGVPAPSIAVFNIAAPVGNTPGNGRHLTNTNDALVEAVRTTTKLFGYTEPLPGNIEIPLAEGDEGLFAGHSFRGVYLAKRPTRISGGIETLLSKLTADPTRDPRLPCIPPPTLGATHAAKGLALFTGDMAGGAYTLVRENTTTPILNTTTRLAESLGTTLARLMQREQAVAAVSAAVQPAVYAEETPADVETQEPVGASPASDIGRSADPIASQEETAIRVYEQLEGVVVAVEEAGSQEAPAPPTPGPGVTVPPSTLGFGGLTTLDPGFGGGSGGMTINPQPSVSITTPTPTITLTVATPDTTLATTTLTIEGTSERGATISIDDGTLATTTADQNGDWSVTSIFSEGVHTLTITASGDAGNTSLPQTRTITVDLTPPAAPMLRASACGTSLSPDICLIATTTTVLTWDTIPDATYYTIGTDTTSETTYTVSLSPNATTTLVVIAHDAAGNSATSTTVTITVIPKPLIINEVAWSGTKASPEDEWVELKNLTEYTLDLATLRLTDVMGKRGISLTGMLAAQSTTNNTDLYLIERRTDATTADHSYHTLFAFLDDAGEELLLMHGDTIVDQTPPVAACGGWCGGSLLAAIRFSETQGTYDTVRTMERGSSADGSLAASWYTNDGYTKSASDIAGNDIFGTPKTENSTHLPSVGWYCDPDTASITDGQVYTPSTTGCVYLSGFIHTNARRWGGVYKGVPGAAIEVATHSLGKALQSAENFPPWTLSDGDTLFVALWENRTFGNDVSDFHQWFQTGTTTTGNTEPPHTNYRIIEWVYGG